MQVTVAIVCAIATFVLISDHLRVVAAAEIGHAVREKREEKYSTEFDDFDVDKVLNSERLVKNYIKCIKDQGPCTREGRELKKYLPDALLTDCSKCSEVQKRQGGKVLTFILQNYRTDWDEILEKYDPEGTFRKRHGYGEESDEGDEA